MNRVENVQAQDTGVITEHMLRYQEYMRINQHAYPLGATSAAGIPSPGRVRAHIPRGHETFSISSLPQTMQPMRPVPYRTLQARPTSTRTGTQHEAGPAIRPLLSSDNDGYVAFERVRSQPAHLNEYGFEDIRQPEPCTSGREAALDTEQCQISSRRESIASTNSCGSVIHTPQWMEEDDTTESDSDELDTPSCNTEDFEWDTRRLDLIICYLRQDHREWYQPECRMTQLERACRVLEETGEFTNEEVEAAVRRMLLLQERGVIRAIPQRLPPVIRPHKATLNKIELHLMTEPLPGMTELGFPEISGYETARSVAFDYATVLKYLLWQVDYCKKLEHQLSDVGLNIVPRDVSALNVCFQRRDVFIYRRQSRSAGLLKPANTFWQRRVALTMDASNR